MYLLAIAAAVVIRAQERLPGLPAGRPLDRTDQLGGRMVDMRPASCCEKMTG
jgi:hypothetical protein